MQILFYFFFLIQIHANCRLRRVYFADRLYTEEELPAEFKLYLPIRGGVGVAPSSPDEDQPTVAA